MLKWFKNCDSPEQAKAKFKDLANKYHPDKPTGNTKKFQEVKSEYDEIMTYFKVHHDIMPSSKQPKEKPTINSEYADNIVNNASEMVANGVKAGMDYLIKKYFVVK